MADGLQTEPETNEPVSVVPEETTAPSVEETASEQEAEEEVEAL
mgnify:CR=1 FL=1